MMSKLRVEEPRSPSQPNFSSTGLPPCPTMCLTQDLLSRSRCTQPALPCGLRATVRRTLSRSGTCLRGRHVSTLPLLRSHRKSPSCLLPNASRFLTTALMNSVCLGANMRNFSSSPLNGHGLPIPLMSTSFQCCVRRLYNLVGDECSSLLSPGSAEVLVLLLRPMARGGSDHSLVRGGTIHSLLGCVLAA